MDENKVNDIDSIKPITDSELGEVTGGASAHAAAGGRNITMSCPKCKTKAIITILSGARGKCNNCNAIIDI